MVSNTRVVSDRQQDWEITQVGARLMIQVPAQRAHRGSVGGGGLVGRLWCTIDALVGGAHSGLGVTRTCKDLLSCGAPSGNYYYTSAYRKRRGLGLSRLTSRATSIFYLGRINIKTTTHVDSLVQQKHQGSNGKGIPGVHHGTCQM